MSDLAPNFRPVWAVTCWVDDKNVYAELPMEPYPYIVKFPLTEGGLHKALALLRDMYRKIGASQEYKIPLNSLKQVKQPKGKVEMTDAQRSAVQEILRKKGLIP